MNTRDRIAKGIEFLRRGKDEELREYLEALGKEDSLARAIVELWDLTMHHRAPAAIRKGRALLSKVSDRPEVADMVFSRLSSAYRMMGETEIAENYLLREKDLLERLHGPAGLSGVEIQHFFLQMFQGDYRTILREIPSFIRKTRDKGLVAYARYILASAMLSLGNVKRALEILKHLTGMEEGVIDIQNLMGIWEMRGLAERMAGKPEAAVISFDKALKICLDMNYAYAPFPVAKLLEMARLAGSQAPASKTIRRSLSLAKKGSAGEMAAATETKAWLLGDDAETTPQLLQAANLYADALQPLEAFRAAAAALLLSYRTRGPEFLRIIAFLRPMFHMFPGFKKDPFVGDVLAATEPLMALERGSEEFSGIRARLVGDLEIRVGDRVLDLHEWHNKKALRLLVYLLLSPRHRLPRDHLAYLLWPGSRYNKKVQNRLYVAASFIRERLGRPDLLVRKREFYQLNDVWTDLSEMETLLHRAEASPDPDQKHELLARAQALARGELLPEFPYDRHIDEYRQYYERLRKRFLGADMPARREGER